MNILKITIATCVAMTFFGSAMADDVHVGTKDRVVVRTDNHHPARHVVHNREWHRIHDHHDNSPHVDINIGH